MPRGHHCWASGVYASAVHLGALEGVFNKTVQALVNEVQILKQRNSELVAELHLFKAEVATKLEASDDQKAIVMRRSTIGAPTSSMQL